MPEQITRATRQILEQVYQEQLRKAQEQGVQKGILMQEQDGWHSTDGQRMEEQALLSSKMALDTARQLTLSEEMSMPEQNETVAIGHRVMTNFLDDEVIINYSSTHIIAVGELVTIVHILSSLDKQHLTKRLEGMNDITEMIVSDKSPAGKALLGAKRNDIVVYGRDMRIRVLDGPDAIEPSPFLNIEISKDE